ncbi:hypothetical protein CFC21_069786 [Triticum aestivum]|uniref:Uncharacterized protein n=2 Tax=Triticum aestivum TaxID=4565 RepID=A0A3B6LFM0_WHEAT|nr:hypothetical protein CFC21_069786 [Triticum aestivum]
MDAEVWTPRSGGRLKPTSRSSSIGSGGSPGCGSNIEYTSLRDMMLEGGGGGGGGGENHGGGGCAFRAGSWRDCNNDNIHEFDASNIGIRNQLLKHAASAYLQSAVVVGGSGGGAREGQGCCLVRLWHRISGGRGRGHVLEEACSWQGCVDDPAEICAAFLTQSARRVAAFFAGIWT